MLVQISTNWFHVYFAWGAKDLALWRYWWGVEIGLGRDSSAGQGSIPYRFYRKYVWAWESPDKRL